MSKNVTAGSGFASSASASSASNATSRSSNASSSLVSIRAVSLRSRSASSSSGESIAPAHGRNGFFVANVGGQVVDRQFDVAGRYRRFDGRHGFGVGALRGVVDGHCGQARFGQAVAQAGQLRRECRRIPGCGAKRPAGRRPCGGSHARCRPMRSRLRPTGFPSPTRAA